MHLAVTDFLSTIRSSSDSDEAKAPKIVSKISDIALIFRTSPSWNEKLRHVQRNRIVPLKYHLDVPTRGNSTFSMVVRAILLHHTTTTVVCEVGLNVNEYSLIEHELRAAIEIFNALEPFVDFSVRNPSTQVATLKSVSFELY